MVSWVFCPAWSSLRVSVDLAVLRHAELALPGFLLSAGQGAASLRAVKTLVEAVPAMPLTRIAAKRREQPKSCSLRCLRTRSRRQADFLS
eukprot:6012030-Amphidinium_carterae.1